MLHGRVFVMKISINGYSFAVFRRGPSGQFISTKQALWLGRMCRFPQRLLDKEGSVEQKSIVNGNIPGSGKPNTLFL